METGLVWVQIVCGDLEIVCCRKAPVLTCGQSVALCELGKCGHVAHLHHFPTDTDDP
jgi:hypothetical protein